MRRKRKLGDWSDDDFETIARKGQSEAKAALTRGGRLAVREAVEKSYLASVETARAVLHESGRTDIPQKSSSAIGAAFNLLSGREYGPDAKRVTRALTESLTSHKACFYDGQCDARAAMNVARNVVDGTKAAKLIIARMRRKNR